MVVNINFYKDCFDKHDFSIHESWESGKLGLMKDLIVYIKNNFPNYQNVEYTTNLGYKITFIIGEDGYGAKTYRLFIEKGSTKKEISNINFNELITLTVLEKKYY